MVSILYTRLDLVTLELEEEGKRAVQLLIILLTAFVCLGSAAFFAMFFLVALFWNTVYRLPILGGIFGVYAVAFVILVIWARYLILHRPKFLSQTLAELRKDVENFEPLKRPEEKGPQS